MKLKNTRTSGIISENVYEAKNLKDKLFGLINKNKYQALVLKTRFGIHTFGMNRPIDVLVLDKQDRVVELRSELPPNRIFFWNPKYSTILELPKRTIKETGTKLGDKILYSS